MCWFIIPIYSVVGYWGLGQARTCLRSLRQSTGLGLEVRPLCGSDSTLVILAMDNSAKRKRVFIFRMAGISLPISQLRNLRFMSLTDLPKSPGLIKRQFWDQDFPRIPNLGLAVHEIMALTLQDALLFSSLVKIQGGLWEDPNLLVRSQRSLEARIYALHPLLSAQISCSPMQGNWLPFSHWNLLQSMPPRGEPLHSLGLWSPELSIYLVPKVASSEY